jgi:hypothetical protein
MLSSAPFRGLTSGESPRKASKGEMDVNHHHSATQPSWLLIRSLARRLRRTGEMNLSQDELLRPVLQEGS